MLQDYLTIGLIGLFAVGIPFALLGLPLYRRYVALSWLEAPADEPAGVTADSH